MSFLQRLFAGPSRHLDPRNPVLWTPDSVGANLSAAGALVSPERAFGLSSYWHAIRSISEDIAKLPLHTFRCRDRGKEAVADHPVARVLDQQANPLMTAFTVREVLMQQALGWGNGFAEIEYGRNGDPVALWPIPASRVTLLKEGTGRTKRIAYRIHRDDASAIDLPPDRVFHLRGPTLDGLEGISVWRIATQSIGIGLAVDEFGASFFGRGANLRGALRHPGKLSEKAQKTLRESFSAMHEGLGNAHSTAILEEGMEWQSMGVEPEAAQFLGTRTFSVEEMARWFRMPPQKMGAILNIPSGFAAVDEDVQSLYVTDTLLPWMTRFEAECRKLFYRDADADLIARFEVIALLRGSAAQRAEYYSKLFHIGAMSQNEVRAAEDQNPVEHGDTYYVPVNVVPDKLAKDGEAGGTPAPTNAPKDERPRAPAGDQTQTDRRREESDRERNQGAPGRRQRSVAPLLPAVIDTFGRARARERAALIRAVKKTGGAGDEFETWRAEFVEQHERWIADAMEPLAIAAMNLVGADVDLTSIYRYAASSFDELTIDLSGLPADELPSAWEAVTETRDEILAQRWVEHWDAEVSDG